MRFSAGDFELSGDDEWFRLKVNYNEYASNIIDIKSASGLKDLQYVVNRMIKELERKLPQRRKTMTKVLVALFWTIAGGIAGFLLCMSIAEAAESPYIKPLQLNPPTLENFAEPKTKRYYQYDNKGNTKYIEVYPETKQYQEYDFKTKKWNYGIIQEND